MKSNYIRFPRLITFLLLPYFLFSHSALANPLNELQTEKELLDRKKSELVSDIEQKVTELETNKSTIISISEQVQTLDNNLVETHENINQTKSNITRTAEEIKVLHNEISIIEKNVSVRDLVLRERIRAIQVKHGTIDFIDVLLESTSLLELVGRVTTINTLLEADRKIMQQQASDVQQLEEIKMLVSKTLSVQRDNKQYLQEQQASLQSQKNEKDNLILELKNEQENINNMKSELTMAYENVSQKSNEIFQEIISLQNRQTSFSQRNIFSSYTVTASCSDKNLDEGLFSRKFNSAGIFTGKSQIFINIAHEYQIDPVLMASIIFLETGSGTSSAVVNYNNPGGLMNPETNWATLLKFNTLEDGLRSTGKTLNRLIHKGGLITINDLGSVYAPIGAANDPTNLNKNWAPNVTKFVNEFGGLIENCNNS